MEEIADTQANVHINPRLHKLLTRGTGADATPILLDTTQVRAQKQITQKPIGDE